MKKYPFVKQEGIKDCGVACLSMIINYYKGYVNYERLIDMTKTNKNGSSALNIIEAAKNIGFKANGIKTDLEHIKNKKINLPCIAHVTIDKTYKHYVVIYEINYKKKELIVADPSSKIKKIKFDLFNDIWDGIIITLYPFKPIPVLDSKITSISFIIKFIKFFKSEMVQIILMSLLITIFSILSSFYFKCLIDRITISSTDNYLNIIFIIFILIYLIKIITNYFRNHLLVFVNQKIDLLLTIDTFKKIILFPYHYYRNRTTGEIVSRITDITTIREMISKFIITVFIDSLLAAISLIILFTINYKLAFIALLIFILNLILIIIFHYIFTPYIEECKNLKDKTTSYMVESISGFESVKGLGIENEIISKFKNKYLIFTNKINKFNKLYNIEQLFKDLIHDIGNVIILFVGINLVIKNKITLGSLITFNTLLNYFLGPIQNLIEIGNDIKETKIVFRRIGELSFSNDNKEINLINKIKGNILIKDLNYSYGSNNYVLKNVNLEIKKGNKVIILGESGIGKSTLFKIIMKYHNINRNHVFLDNVDINDISSNKIKDSIVYISQNETLFTDTVYNNLTLLSTNNNGLNKILDICCIKDVIKNNQLGLNTLIEENGFNFSGGEKQRLILSRALMKKFNILIIDEGLNQVDVNLERVILKRLFKEYHDKTIIVISHRKNNIDLYDQMIKFENNKMISSVIKNV